MIKITGNAIELKQGDSGAVRFFFKDKQTDFPYILEKFDPEYIDGNRMQSAIKFIVRQDPSDSSKAAIERYYDLDTKADANDINFYRFKNNIIVEHPTDGKLKPDTLYRRKITEDSNGWEFVFYKKNTDDSLTDAITYDYINSSINIVFNTEDTKNLFYKTYYYEIAYIEGTNLNTKDETITLKHTLIESTPFVVTGALVK